MFVEMVVIHFQRETVVLVAILLWVLVVVELPYLIVFSDYGWLLRKGASVEIMS